MTPIGFTVIGEPQPAGSKKAYPRGRHVSVVDANPKAKPWKAAVAAEAARVMAERGLRLLDGPVALDLVFVRVRPKGHYRTGRNAHLLRDSAPEFPITKPDALKLARGVEDALTGVVYRDDAQVIDGRQRKEYGEPARVEVFVREIAPASGVRAVTPIVGEAAA